MNERKWHSVTARILSHRCCARVESDLRIQLYVFLANRCGLLSETPRLADSWRRPRQKQTLDTHAQQYLASGKLHKDYTVYEDVKSILPIYIHVYPVRPCRDDLCEIIPSIWGAVARYDRSDLFIIACGQSHLFMNMLWSAMISCELSYLVAMVLLVLWGGVCRHKIID